jgi:catechol 2,3-dioxygenase-like lactoylglutathione lyase family enzyme
LLRYARNDNSSALEASAMLSTFAFVLAVRDLDRSAAYYRDVLGFRLLWEDGTDWRLAERDGVRLMLGHCPDEKPATEIFPHNWFGYLETDDLAALRDELIGRGAECSEPKDQPYGMREIIVTTIDGHRIVFGEETSKPGG